MQNKIYIGSIQLNNYTSFSGENFFDLRDENGFIHQWTVILGNNNTGKTNFLKAVTWLEPTINGEFEGDTFFFPKHFKFNENNGQLKNNKSLRQLSIKCTLFYDKSKDISFYKKIKKVPHNSFWGFDTGTVWGGNSDFYENLKIYGYGVSRHYSDSRLSEKEDTDNSLTLFDPNKKLINLEEWLLQLDYATKNNDPVAESQLTKLKDLIKSEIFPEIIDIRFKSESARSFVEFQTLEGWRRLKELGYGYQSTLSWIFDLSKKLFERYPDSKNPLKEPAIVLIDELDLHLHPQWQRQIIKYLSNIFTQTQFIVTTHSPFIIQSIEKINLFILNRTEDGIKVSRPSYKTFKGWNIEEILDEVLGLGEKTKSDNYLSLMKQFDEALDANNYQQAQLAYNQLSEILHPTSAERKLLKVQLSQLIPND